MLRRIFVAGLVMLLLGLPVAALWSSGQGAGELAAALLEAFLAALAAVGWVFVPQLALGVAVLGAALQRVVLRLAGERAAAPPWIDPAIESALLLGMLGTLHGMVDGFAGLDPGSLQPGPLIQALGTALRSSFVGFGIALLGVWVREAPAQVAPA